LTGLPPDDHGFHVHEFGDLSNGCLGEGLHCNSFRSPHGGPDGPPSSRHVGDLGNIMTPASPSLYFRGAKRAFFPLLSLFKQILRQVVQQRLSSMNPSLPSPEIVESLDELSYPTRKKDDLGRGGDAESRKTGNPGARIACGIIGYTSPTLA
uniref:Superoxide dismutase n=1 Tax=Angiostrongylus cantonensis TaxID=6313 RepID=A0A0K0D7B5_ANGCA